MHQNQRRYTTYQDQKMRVTLGKILLGLYVFLATSLAAGAAEVDEVKTPVPLVLDGRLTVQSAAGTGEIPIQVSLDWNRPQPEVTRAVIIVHGWPRRDVGAADYLRQHVPAAAHNTIFITPQFLIEADVTGHHLPAATLRWDLLGWRQAYAAQAPAPISSFDVMDTIFQRLANRALFPNLNTIVLAGHSAGGQFVQRYAVLGHASQALANDAIHVRYVVANPATYLYFNDQRPQPTGHFSAVDEQQCPGFNDWNLGLANKLPSYASRPVDAQALLHAYLRRDVVYLLGTADNDPQADALGQSCRYKIQGATRYARGLAYAAYLQLLTHGHVTQHFVAVPNIAHHSYALYSSACALPVLFDTPGPDCQIKP